MSESEWAGLGDFPSIADEQWLMTNGDGPHEHREDSWEPLNLAELAEHPPIEPTLGGLTIAYPGKRHVFSGPQESAKTLCAYVLGLEVVRQGGKVVLIDFEMGPWDARNRLRELGGTSQEIAAIPYIEPSEKATPPVIMRIVALEPRLVIVDAAAGAYQLQELDDNKRSDVERFTAVYVREFWKAGIATVVLDHVTKNADTRGTYAIGSERKVGGTDVHLGFEVIHPIKRGGKGTYKIVTHKDRGGFLKRGKLAEFELESDPDSHRITWTFKVPTGTDEEHPFRPTVKMEQASRWLEKQMEERVPMSHVEKGIGGDREAGRLAIQLLVDEGYFREISGPRNARLMTIARPYREEYDDLSATSPDLSGIRATPLPDSLPPVRSTGGVSGEVETPSGEVSSPNLLEDDGIPF